MKTRKNIKEKDTTKKDTFVPGKLYSIEGPREEDIVTLSKTCFYPDEEDEIIQYLVHNHHR